MPTEERRSHNSNLCFIAQRIQLIIIIQFSFSPLHLFFKKVFCMLMMILYALAFSKELEIWLSS